MPPLPLWIAVAQTQAEIGALIEAELAPVAGRPVACVLTHVVVDEDDPAFDHPTKPIGPFYSAEQARELEEERGWQLVHDAGRGYRRVVPSPQPLDVVELTAVQALVDAGTCVIACGGGGIPVARADGRLVGVDAVIDKDWASALLAVSLGADRLLILTDVAAVSRGFGTPEQKEVRELTAAEAEELAPELAAGSMRPKVEAAARFVRAGGGEALITSAAALAETRMRLTVRAGQLRLAFVVRASCADRVAKRLHGVARERGAELVTAGAEPWSSTLVPGAQTIVRAAGAGIPRCRLLHDGAEPVRRRLVDPDLVRSAYDGAGGIARGPRLLPLGMQDRPWVFGERRLRSGEEAGRAVPRRADEERRSRCAGKRCESKGAVAGSLRDESQDAFAGVVASTAPASRAEARRCAASLGAATPRTETTKEFELIHADQLLTSREGKRPVSAASSRRAVSRAR